MRASGVASRRFYNAFYRWTLLSESSPACHQPVPIRRLSQTGYSRQRIRGKDAVFLSLQQGGRRSNSNASARQSVDDLQVHSSSKKPFDKLEPWGEVVRYKSAAGVTIEVSVPSSTLDSVNERNSSLGALAGVEDLQVDIGDVITKKNASGELVSVRSVLASGTIEEIEALRETLRRFHERPIGGYTSLNDSSFQFPEFRRVQSAVDHQPFPEPGQGRGRINQSPHRQTNDFGQTAVNQRRKNATDERRPPRTDKKAAKTKAVHGEIRMFIQKFMRFEGSRKVDYDAALKKEINDIRNRTKCDISNLAGKIGITGPIDTTEDAMKSFESAIYEVCERQSIPRPSFETNVPLMKWLDAKPVVEEQRRQDLIERTKTALRSLISPVVLVLAWKRDAKPGSQLRGITISSMTSVTMTPTPYVSFNVRLPSRSWDAMSVDPHIRICVLSNSPDGAAIAHLFTKPHEDPREPFNQLKAMGYHLIDQAIEGESSLHSTNTPKHTDRDPKNALICQISAMVDWSKCVQVGDHKLVVAKILKVRQKKEPEDGAEEFLGLAYANRGYRTIGQELEPAQIPSVPEGQDVVAKDESNSSAGLEHGDFSPQEEALEDNSLFDAIESEEQDSELHEQIEEEDAPGTSSQRLTQALASTSSGYTPFQNGITSTQGSQIRSKSTLSTSEQTLRAYSTSTWRPIPENHPASKSSLASQVTDPSLLTTTVGEFLNKYQDVPYKLRRMRALIKAKREAEEASKLLEESLADGTLTPEASERLENIVLRNERWVSKKLALHSAYDLKLMLDKGKVNFRLARWMESSIEKGQAVLLAEAQEARALLDSGKLDREGFLAVKEVLERNNLTLATEAMRLRQMVGEEGEEGVAAQVPEEKRFDGFSGNR